MISSLASHTYDISGEIQFLPHTNCNHIIILASYCRMNMSIILALRRSPIDRIPKYFDFVRLKKEPSVVLLSLLKFYSYHTRTESHMPSFKPSEMKSRNLPICNLHLPMRHACGVHVPIISCAHCYQVV